MGEAEKREIQARIEGNLEIYAGNIYRRNADGDIVAIDRRMQIRAKLRLPR